MARLLPRRRAGGPSRRGGRARGEVSRDRLRRRSPRLLRRRRRAGTRRRDRRIAPARAARRHHVPAKGSVPGAVAGHARRSGMPWRRRLVRRGRRQGTPGAGPLAARRNRVALPRHPGTAPHVAAVSRDEHLVHADGRRGARSTRASPAGTELGRRVIRLTLLACYVGFFSIAAFRQWFWSLCALILLMAVIEHPDMPKTIFGIQGLNPWNLLLIAVVAGWARSRAQEGLRFDLPRPVTALLLAYLGVVLVGFVRMMANRAYL